jgi:hypothetical protein
MLLPNTGTLLAVEQGMLAQVHQAVLRDPLAHAGRQIGADIAHHRHMGRNAAGIEDVVDAGAEREHGFHVGQARHQRRLRPPHHGVVDIGQDGYTAVPRVPVMRLAGQEGLEMRHPVVGAVPLHRNQHAHWFTACWCAVEMLNAAAISAFV